MEMVTNYNKADMVKFAQFVDDRAAKGMLFKDKDGRNKITEELIDDWHVSLSVGKTYNCPKVQMVTQSLFIWGDSAYLDLEEFEIGGITNIHMWAADNGVMIVAPWVYEVNELCQIPHSEELVFAGCNNRRTELKKIVQVKRSENDIPYIDAKFPHMQFPVYSETGDAIAIGIVVHETDF